MDSKAPENGSGAPLLPSPTPPVTCTLSDSKERTIRFSMAARKRLREKYADALFGREKVLTFFFTGEDGTGQLDFDKLVPVLTEGLKHEFEGGERDITVERVEELLTIQDAPVVYYQVMKALGVTYSKKLPEKNAAPPAPPQAPVEQPIPITTTTKTPVQ